MSKEIIQKNLECLNTECPLHKSIPEHFNEIKGDKN